MKLFSCNPPIEEIRQLSAYASCDCFQPPEDSPAKWKELSFHDDTTPPEVATEVEKLVAFTAERGLEEFVPRKELGGQVWAQVKRLPPSIGLMSRVTRMDLYGSHLVAIPREIMLLTQLAEFDPYTSYRLHWFPYELARCPSLRKSRISTRALYGNRTFRPPFPRLPDHTVAATFCSVCDTRLERERFMQRWISLWVATDVVPLLVQTCSKTCLAKLPAPAVGSVPRLHKGGLSSRPPKSRGSM